MNIFIKVFIILNFILISFTSYADGVSTKAISKWNFIPSQVVFSKTKVGLLAFHHSGISKVEIYVNKKKYLTLSQVSFNDQSLTNEFWFSLERANLTLGENLLTALVYPVNGVTTELNELLVYFNNNDAKNDLRIFVSNDGDDESGTGELNKPYQTIVKALENVAIGGEVVIMKSGVYFLDGSYRKLHNKLWTTIRQADSLPVNSVVLTNSSRQYVKLGFDKLKFSNLKIDFANITMFSLHKDQSLWFDNVEWVDSNYKEGVIGRPPLDYDKMFNPVSLSKNIEGYYVTNSVAHHTLWGFVDAKIARNVKVHHVIGDAYTNTQLLVNAEVYDMLGNETGKHSDVFQLHGKQDNVIAFNVYGHGLGGVAYRAKYDKVVHEGVQNIFIGTINSEISNVAIVDVCIENKQSLGLPPFSQMSSKQSNVLYRNITTINQKWFLRFDLTETRQFKPDNVFVQNCKFPGLLVNRVEVGFSELPSGINFSDSNSKFLNPPEGYCMSIKNN